MNHHARVSCSVLVGAWMLMMPPVPLGTELPPISEWRELSAHKTAAECGSKLEAMRDSARRTVTGDPNASAYQVAGALGQLQAKCVETKDPSPAPAPAPAPPPAPASPPAPPAPAAAQ